MIKLKNKSIKQREKLSAMTCRYNSSPNCSWNEKLADANIRRDGILVIDGVRDLKFILALRTNKATCCSCCSVRELGAIPRKRKENND